MNPQKKGLHIDSNIGLIQSIARHPQMLTAEELSQALSMSPKTIYAQAKNGKLPAIRIGQSVRFDPRHVADWLSSKVA